MYLIDKKVTHEVFGTGKIVTCDDSYVTVGFPSGEKEFVFPDAFGTYLFLLDEDLGSFVDGLVEEKLAEEREKEAELRRLQELEEERRLADLERRRLRTRKIHPESQSVFWCSKEEEESIFEDWKVSPGTIKSGPRKGENRQLARVGENSGCLLTYRERSQDEKERSIFAVFMAAGPPADDGNIHADSKFRLKLSKEESEKLLFWNYYLNKRYPHKITWNTGRHRYFDNVWMGQILRDIVALREGDEKEEAQRFFSRFCRLNNIKEEEIPQPDGALKRNR